MTVHPSRKYFVTASADSTWCFYDLEKAECLKQVSPEDPSEAYTAVQFHPDGLILGTGERGHEWIVGHKDQRGEALSASFSEIFEIGTGDLWHSRGCHHILVI